MTSDGRVPKKDDKSVKNDSIRNSRISNLVDQLSAGLLHVRHLSPQQRGDQTQSGLLRPAPSPGEGARPTVHLPRHARQGDQEDEGCPPQEHDLQPMYPAVHLHLREQLGHWGPECRGRLGGLSEVRRGQAGLWQSRDLPRLC